jgi:hypothetical protein
LAEKLLTYVNALDLDRLSNQKYYSSNLDGLNWEFYIDTDDKIYNIIGYENMPEELEILLDKLQELNERGENASIDTSPRDE